MVRPSIPSGKGSSGRPPSTIRNRFPTKEDFIALWETSGLKKKILFTLGMLVLFRLAAFIPIWGVDVEAFAQGAANQLIAVLDLFSGGALGRLSIAGLGIGPYITASIVMQLLTVVFPRLEQLQKEEGEEGRRKLSQYTRYFTIVLSLFQSVMVSTLIINSGALLPEVPPALFYAICAITLTSGCMVAVWVAEMITAKGIGNGGSMLVFIGIVSRLPFFVGQIGESVGQITPAQSFLMLLMLLVFLGTIGFVIVLQEASRKIYVVSAKRQVGNKVYGGQGSHIPFKLNPGSVMPIIFAFALLGVPMALINTLIQSNTNLGQFEPFVLFLSSNLGSGGWLYVILEVMLIFFFSFFYASIMPNMQPRDIADQLKKYGSSIPGIKPGKPTSDYLEKLLSRITFIGATFMAFIALVPNALESFLGQNAGVFVFRGLGATSLIILVGVALDIVNQIKVNMLARQYEGFMKP